MEATMETEDRSVERLNEAGAFPTKKTQSTTVHGHCLVHLMMSIASVEAAQTCESSMEAASVQALVLQYLEKNQVSYSWKLTL